MPTFIALLRGINVVGRNKVPMAELRDMLGKMGFANPRTLLQSGNVVLDGGRRSATGIERLLEKETAARFSAAIEIMVRDVAEWQEVIARNPFLTEAKRNPSRMLVMFLKATPTPKNVSVLRAANQGPELLQVIGRELYVVYPNGVAETKLSNALIERKLGVRATGRNWNTILKLADLATGE